MPLSDFENLDLSSGSDTEDLFASPSATPSKSKAKAKAAPKQQEDETVNPTTRPFPETRYDAEQAREESLRRELEGVRNINEVIEGVISSLETAKGNMAVRRRSRRAQVDYTAYCFRMSHGQSHRPLLY